MAITPIRVPNSTLVYSSKHCSSSIRSPKFQSHMCSIPFRSSSSSRSGSVAVKCSNPGANANASSDQKINGGGLKNLLPDSEDLAESLITEELVNFLAGLVDDDEIRVLLDQATQGVESATKEPAQIEKLKIKSKKMKRYIHQLKTSAVQIERCEKLLSEAIALVKEANYFIQDKYSTKSENETPKNKEMFESLKSAAISAIIDTLIKALLK